MNAMTTYYYYCGFCLRGHQVTRLCIIGGWTWAGRQCLEVPRKSWVGGFLIGPDTCSPLLGVPWRTEGRAMR